MERTGVPTLANQSCRGLQVQGSNRGKPRLPGVQIQISLLSSIMHFGMELGYVKPRFISRLPCPHFSVPKDYLLGTDLVVAAAARRWDEEPKAHFILASPKSARTVEWSGGTARPVAGRKTFILNNNKDSLLVAGFTHERKTRQASLFH